MSLDIEKMAELERLAADATAGDWQVIETELPCRLGRPHIERRIFTAKDNPQLKAPYPVVNGSVALGNEEIPVHHMISITAEDAAYIAAANPAVLLELVAEIKRMRLSLLDFNLERDQLKAENQDGLAVIRTQKQQLDCYIKDAERYRLMRDETFRPGCLSSDTEKAKYLDEYMVYGDMMDEIVDAQLAKVKP